ncbi:hypothetical protein [Microvirga lotononidis]|uniref:Uncharacterized protein n=1 Tax=Microvirga lotononidis TaxID=864069 RepID=I4YS70_9HYPH|nr:hypothetical protein [Microvirga lotononidis]EIM26812.1 hypothetical protein MicloDRAFT_00033620 [Microvirga lotononidis]WQO31714.1 hypothetical protein U0023_30580 [Microvirga lotononidis]
MPHAWKECEDLAKADIDISEGERRVAQQITLIGWMAQKRHDTEEATKLLWNYQTTLAGWREHRRLILEAIERLEGLGHDIPVR